MSRDDEYYPAWITEALKHARYWIRKAGIGGTMTTYATTRPNAVDVQGRIKAAVAAYYQTMRVLPASIAVNPGEVEAAKGAVAALGLRLAVNGNGGANVGDVWLEVSCATS